MVQHQLAICRPECEHFPQATGGPGTISTFHKFCSFPHDFHIVSYFVGKLGKPSKSSLSTMVRYGSIMLYIIYIYIRRCVEWLDGRWVVESFASFPSGKISHRRCIACHNQEERTYVCVTYGMQLSWLSILACCHDETKWRVCQPQRAHRMLCFKYQGSF